MQGIPVEFSSNEPFPAKWILTMLYMPIFLFLLIALTIAATVLFQINALLAEMMILVITGAPFALIEFYA